MPDRDPKEEITGGTSEQRRTVEQIRKRIAEYIGSDTFIRRQKNFVQEEFNKFSDFNRSFMELFQSEEEAKEGEARALQSLFQERMNDFPPVKIAFMGGGDQGAYRQNIKTGKDRIILDSSTAYDENQLHRTAAHEIAHSLYDRGFWGSANIEGADVFGDGGDYGNVQETMEDIKEAVRTTKTKFDDYTASNAEIRAEVWGERFRLEKIMDDIKNKRYDKYDFKEEELEEVRKYIDKAGLGSPIDSEFKEGHFDILKTFAPDSRLPQMFPKEDAVKLMNMVASKKVATPRNTLS